MSARPPRSPDPDGVIALLTALPSAGLLLFITYFGRLPPDWVLYASLAWGMGGSALLIRKAR